ncbi:hypothetical protein MMC25_006756 [Agyrium rufum]|nr:hypothetical protein [Agyrium rufum]
MSLSALRQPTARAAFRAATKSHRAGLAGASFTRGKVTLPELPYSYDALEPSISGKIMELHHKNHHQTYVTSFNNFSEQFASAVQASNAKTQASLTPLINFHAGGHVNHSLFWENLAPAGSGGGGEPSGKLGEMIKQGWGSLDAFKKEFNASLAGVQGSGWTWLVKDKTTGSIAIRNYQNRKAEYFGAIWDVINWKTAEKRFEA